MATIFYAVIALKAGEEVRAVAEELERQGLNGLAEWLRQNEGVLYGDAREDWKPFMDAESIRDFLTDDPRIYSSVTGLIDDQIDDEANDWTVLSRQRVDLYIIDVFALFLKKFQDLATRMDNAVALTEGKCCLIIPYRVSAEFQRIRDSLVASYTRSWGAVYRAFTETGSLSRMIVAPDDLRNFRHYLVKLLPVGGYDPETKQKVRDDFFNSETRSTVPRLRT
jgi:hypothetical protein